jgi:hypothetical protein
MDDSQPTGRWPVFNLSGTTMSGSVRADLCLTDAIVTIPSMGSWHSYKPETVTGCFLRIGANVSKRVNLWTFSFLIKMKRTASISEKR